MEDDNEECNCDNIKNINLVLMGVLLLLILIFFRKLYIINSSNTTVDKLSE